MTIQNKDGQTFSITVFALKGAGALGIDWADVDTKYRSLIAGVGLSDQQIEGSLEVIHDFSSVKHVSELVDLLHL